MPHSAIAWYFVVPVFVKSVVGLILLSPSLVLALLRHRVVSSLEVHRLRRGLLGRLGDHAVLLEGGARSIASRSIIRLGPRMDERQ